MADDTLAGTRRSLHGVAELVLAGPQYRGAGTIRLRITPGGFATVAEPDLRVDGVHLVAAGQRVPIAGHSCAELATAAGVAAGAPENLYHDGSGVRPDEPLSLDADAAGWLARCWGAGDAALRRLAPDERPVLWPEHFDVAIRVDDTNFGVSPGDGFIPEPYAYIGPPSPREGEFWNQPFGAARPLRELDDARIDTVLAFFAEGRDLVRG